MSLLLFRRSAGTVNVTPSIGLTADDATISVVDGGSSVAITLTLSRANFTGNVTLAVSGLPSGVTGTFSDSTLTGAESTSTLTISASGASPVTDDAFTITASGSGVSDATVAGTVTVTASSSRGVPVSGHILGEDFSGYADTTAFLANVAPNGNGGTGQLYRFPVHRTLFEISSDITFNGNHVLKMLGDNTQGPPGAQMYLTTPKDNVAHYWVQAYTAGYTLSGSDTNQSAGRKLGFMGYDIASGRVGTEWSNGGIFCGGGWNSTSNDSYGGSIDGTSTGPNAPYNELTSTYGATEGVTQSAPYPVTASGGVWHTPQWVCYYQEFQRISSTQVRVRHWTWLYGTEPSVGPFSSFIFTLRVGSIPKIDRVQIDDTFNQPTGSRYASAGQAEYIAEWRVYDLDVTPNPLNLY